jgi:hypothetical protein
MADANAQAPATEQPTTTEQPGMYLHCCEARIASVLHRTKFTWRFVSLLELKPSSIASAATPAETPAATESAAPPQYARPMLISIH